jgi:hypothetical protein
VTEVHCGLESINLMSQISMNPKPSEHRREPHRAAVVASVNVNRRRSSRIALTAAIELSGEDREKCSFTIPARATNLNKHGAIVKLNRDLLVGSVVVVEARDSLPSRINIGDLGWRLRRDLNPCYRRERTTTLRKYNDLQEAGGHLSPC